MTCSVHLRECGEKASWAGPVGKARPLDRTVPDAVGTARGIAVVV